ncbi:hypothetical protein Tco_1086104 [Tanacetum coccineum]
MVDKEEITYTVGMFRATLMLPVETLKQPFIPLSTHEYIQLFLKIVGYQGFVDKVSAFYTTNLARPWQTMFKVFNRCLTSRTIREKEPRSVETSSQMKYLRKSLKIRFKQQKPSTITPPPLSDDRKKSDGTEFVDSVFLNEEDSSDRIEPESHKDKHNEINDDDNDETKDDKKDDDDHDDHALIKTRRTRSLKVRTEKMQTPIPSPSRTPRKDLSLDKAITEELTGIKEKVGEVLHDIVPKIALNATKDRSEDNLPWIVANAVKKERESSQAAIPVLTSQEFTAHAPKITEELFRIHMQNTILNVHPTTSASTATITSDLQEQLYLKMKSDLQAQVVDPELDDAFHKCDHDEHQADDAPPDGEKIAKRKKDI